MTEYESVELVEERTVWYLAASVVVAVLTAVFAQVAVPYPLSPAPLTLQTMGVYLAGLLLGPVWGAFALVLYALVGIAGAPVFAGASGGLGVVAGPTGGFIIGFPVAAAVIGAIVHRQVEPRRLDEVAITLQVVALLVGLVVVYAVGSVWLAFVTDQPLTTAVVQNGVVFVPGDALKAAAVMSLVTGGYLTHARVAE